jgi:hypothetical protein
MRAKGRIGRIVIVVAVLAFGVQEASASEGKRKPKPDLYVSGAEFLPVGEDWALRGEDNVLKFDAATQNRGKGAAKPSKTEIVFVPYTDGPTNVKPIRAFSLDVPRIRGASPTKYYSYFGTAKSPPLSFNGDPLGTYQAYWCADAENKVKESNERNNCVVPGGDLQRLYLGKRHWVGTVSGTVAVGDEPTSASEDWSSTDAELEFERFDSLGFHYLFNGTVSWATHGTDADHCSYSGSDTEIIRSVPGQADIVLSYGEEEYGGTAYSGLDYSYPVTVQCPTETIQTSGPSGIVLSAFHDGNILPMPFGTEALAGNETVVQDRSRFIWEFH